MALDNTNSDKIPLVFNDQRTKEKIDLHLRDINDEITADDIANIKTDVTPNTPGSETAAEKEATDHLQKKRMEEKKNHEDGNNSSNINSSWNILDEQ